MRIRPPFRLQPALWLAGLGALLSLAEFASAQAPPPPTSQSPSPVVLDRVVAVVNNHAILLSDLDEEVQLSVLDPGQGSQGSLTPQHALEQLISRSLIQQQMREEDVQAVEAAQDEVKARLTEIRTELPACVRQNCASDAGWKLFLATHSLTQERVEAYLRFRVEILRFIELRFRQGIQISPQEIETYYRENVLPQYAKGDEIPSLDKVSARLEEILLQQRVNVLFDDWLNNLRKQGEVEVLDPTLETPATEAPAQGAKEPPGAAVLKGHDLSRADKSNQMSWALAPEGRSYPLSPEAPPLPAASASPANSQSSDGKGAR